MGRYYLTYCYYSYIIKSPLSKQKEHPVRKSRRLKKANQEQESNRSVDIGSDVTTNTSTTTIRANCPECGDVQSNNKELVIRVCADDERGSYFFRCPDCGAAVAKEASRRIVDLLRSNGCKMQVWHLPAELTEARVAAPPHHTRRHVGLPPAPPGGRVGARAQSSLGCRAIHRRRAVRQRILSKPGMDANFDTG